MLGVGLDGVLGDRMGGHLPGELALEARRLGREAAAGARDQQADAGAGDEVGQGRAFDGAHQVFGKAHGVGLSLVRGGRGRKAGTRAW